MKYEGFTKDSDTVKWMWEILTEISESERRSFLIFVTGSDRSPLRGLGQLNLVITRQANDEDDNRLPSSHTCFNHLILPEFKSKENLRIKLMKAIVNCTGFGLI